MMIHFDTLPLLLNNNLGGPTLLLSSKRDISMSFSSSLMFGTILRDILVNDKHIFDRLEIMQKLKSALTKKAKKILLDTNFK